jgi:hypothetical protein
MFSTHATLLPKVPLPVTDATNIANSSDATTILQQEEIETYVHRYVKLSIYENK